VAALAFPDGSFDLVVSTLSMHHWADPTAGVAEIGRVLRPGAPGAGLGLAARRPATSIRTTPRAPARPGPTHPWHSARLVGATPWQWPWTFTLIQRIELMR
jgi:SAM-dependent methyltransferase